MFSNKTSTGMCSVIEKKIQLIIKEHLLRLESRIIDLADSKVDATEYYLKLKTKVETADFEKILNQFLTLNKQLIKTVKSSEELSKKVEENEDMWNKNVKVLKESFTFSTNSLQSQMQQVLAEVVAARNDRSNKEDKDEPKIDLETIKELQNRIIHNENKIKEVETSNTNTINSISTNINKRLTNLKNDLKDIDNKCIEDRTKIDNLALELLTVNNSLILYKTELNHYKLTISKQFTQESDRMKEMTESIEQIRNKYILIERRQTAINNKQKEEYERAFNQSMEIYEKANELANNMFKESNDIKSYFSNTKDQLEILIQRLKIENDLLIREHKRIYEKNRSIETNLPQLKNECTEISKSHVQCKTYYVQHRDMFNVPFMSETSASIIHYPQRFTESISHRANPSIKKHKAGNKKMNVSDHVTPTHDVLRTRRNSAKIEKSKQVTLNRFRTLVD